MTKYNLLIGKDKTIAFDLYEGINIFWKFNDSIENKSQVSKIEKNYKWYGFINFFNDNFSGLDTPPPTYLYTQGNEFLLPNRTSYVGFYHFMSNGKAMTGKYHGDGPEFNLIQIVSIPTPSSSETTSTETPTITTFTQTSSPSSGGGSSGGGGY